MEMFRTCVAAVVVGLSACSYSAPDIDTGLETSKPVQATSSDFTFRSSGLSLSGIFDTPSVEAEALIIFVHGYGESNIREWNSYSDLRTRFNEIGIATALWDKPGQGLSEGEFDINQSVESNAQELLDAADYFRGGTQAAVNVKTGAVKEPCSTCARVQQQFDVNGVRN